MYKQPVGGQENASGCAGTVEYLFLAESLTLFTSIKLSFFPSIREAVRMAP